MRKTRPRGASAPPALRFGIQALGAIAPPLAARVVERLWFMPPRPKIARPILEQLAGGEFLPLTVYGRRVAAWSFGEGPAIVLMHGWGGYAGQLLGFVQPLVERGFRVVLPDAPGHGASAESRHGWRQSSFFDFQATLQAIAERLGPIHGLLAHSGGCTGSTMALRAGLAVDRVVFIAPMAVPAAYVDVFAAGIGASAAVMRRFQARAAARLGFTWDDLDATQAPRHVRTPPVLVVHDREDSEVPWREGDALASAWPGATLHTTSGLGHHRILGNPEVIAKAVGFLVTPPTA